jgi:hypothetical protein
MIAGSGYSGTPLPRKLGIREGDAVCIIGDPGNAHRLVAPLPSGATFGDDPAEANVVLLFVTERDVLADAIGGLGRAVFPDRSLWIAWPKRRSGVTTDMTEDAVREVALPLGLVDNKVCAIDATWAGLRLVWRKELRAVSPR